MGPRHTLTLLALTATLFTLPPALADHGPEELALEGGTIQDPIEPLGPATATITATPGYFNLYNARLEEKIQQGGPQAAVRYEILIENFSNGDTWFEFEVQEPVPDGFRAVQPEPILLQSVATGGTQTNGTVTFTVYTPANTPYTNEIGAIQLNITSYYDGPPEASGQSSEISSLTQARGVHLPGPGALVVSLAGVVTALVLGVVLGSGHDPHREAFPRSMGSGRWGSRWEPFKVYQEPLGPMTSKHLDRGLIGLVVTVLALDVFVLSFLPWWYGTPTTLENFVGLAAILPTAWFLWAAPELDAPPWLPSLVKTGAGIVAASAVLMALAMVAGLHWSAMPPFYLGFLGVLVVGLGFLVAILKETIPSLAATVDRPETLRVFAWSSKLAVWGLGLLALLALLAFWGGGLGSPARWPGQVLVSIGMGLVLGALALLSWGVLDLAYHGLWGPGDGSEPTPGVVPEP